MKQEEHEENPASMQQLRSRGVEIFVSPVVIKIAESGSILVSYQ
jgi:hypothetical protein